jgi:membrane-associated phospholipid phosphatase
LSEVIVEAQLENATPFENWWRALTFVDRLYLGYFLAVGALIVAQRHRLATWPILLVLHIVCFVAISALVWAAKFKKSRTWSFLHDWYPVLMFIVLFEEVARLSFLVRDDWQDAYILRLESWLFREPPTVWVERFASTLLTEILEIGYFSYYLFFLIVGGVLYLRFPRQGNLDRSGDPFQQLLTAVVVAYFICYGFYIAFPTEGPARTLAHLHSTPLPGGPFQWLVQTLQRHGGVHGNAFPSAHIASAMASLIIAWRYAPRLAIMLLPFFLLMCVGSVYDRYHYVSDIVGGIVVGALPAFVVLMRAKGRTVLNRASS